MKGELVIRGEDVVRGTRAVNGDGIRGWRGCVTG